MTELDARLTARLEERISAWRDELVNLSRTNRLLYFKHTKTASLEIVDAPAATIAARLATPSGWRFFNPPEDDETDRTPRADELVVADKDAKALAAALRLLERGANQEFIDKGLWTLYLGLGMLRWVDEDDKPVATPLLLVPVTFGRESTQDEFRLVRADEDAVLNPALAVKFSQAFGIELPPLEDATDVDPGLVTDAVERAVGGRGWTVDQRAVLTTFTFHKEAMYRDLLDNGELIAEHPVVRILALGPDNPSAGELDFDIVNEGDLDRVAPPEGMVTVRDADSTQRRCILAAREARSFVMDGPPGTGKSQTITNIIAELLNAGRSVLFVSEKAAALEVVQRRLAEAGLDEFALELHSHHTTRAAVASELGRALRTRPRAKRGFEESDIASLKRARKSLSSYAQAMNEVRQPLGRSLHEVLGRVSALEGAPVAPVPSELGANLSPDDLASLVEVAETLGRNWGPVSRGADFLWSGVRDDSMSAARKGEIARSLKGCVDDLDALVTRLCSFEERTGLSWTRNAEDAKRAATLQQLSEEGSRADVGWLTSATLEPVQRASVDLREEVARHRELSRRLVDLVGLSFDDLDGARSAGLRDASAALSSLRPAVVPAASSTIAELDGSIAALEAVAVLADVSPLAEKISEAFGLAFDHLSIESLTSLAKLAQLVGSSVAPEPSWFAPFAQSTVDAAVDVLGALVADFSERAASLGEIFKPTLLEVDIRGLRARFTETHRGLRKLGGSYRDDKRALSAITLAGRVDKKVLQSLDAAVAWSDLAAKLHEAESLHAAALGEYYVGPDADFGRITEAVEVARVALRLVGEQANPEALARQLSGNGSPDPTLPGAGQRLAGVLELLHPVEELAGEHGGTLRAMPIGAVMEWAADAAEAFGVIRAAKAHVEEVAGDLRDLPAVVEALDTKSALVGTEEHLDRPDGVGALLGTLYEGLATDWEAVDVAVAWAAAVRACAGGGLRRRGAAAILAGDVGDDLTTVFTQWEKSAADFLGLFADLRRSELTADLEASFSDAEELLERLAGSIADVDEWSVYLSSMDELSKAGLHATLNFCIAEGVDGVEVRPVVERALLTAWADAAIAADGSKMAPFGAADRDALVSRFADLDRQLVATAAATVVNACSARRPTSVAGTAAVIQKEAQKQRKHMPVRQLLERAGAVAQQLKPCFMMSPLSVSTYLPPTMRFDVVIFDEASQVRPADAINCIYRGGQLIVAGDQKQLPPTSFFTSGSDGDDVWDEDELEEFESVLDLCKASGGLPSLPLLWHYRSQHEALITYSNYSFYDGAVHTFPGAAEEASDLGVELFKVDGLYRRGGARDNPIEAAAVVDRILFHRHHHPSMTLGVVTFSAAQEDAVLVELERRATVHPELGELLSSDRLDGFFVKNLENVQGDERDLIIFSIGYGPDENGKFTMQLGPLTRANGWRRLNVAITRARRRVEVVTSVLADDFPADVSGSVAHLKRYLNFCERGISALALDLSDGEGDAESVFEEEVLRSIRGWGFEAVPQVGCAGYRIDIAVRDPRRPGRFLLAVECDGAMYHSSKVARDRDRLRQGVLEGLGWRFHRIWGISWFRDRAAQEARLRAAIEETLDGERRVSRPAPLNGPVIEVEEYDFSKPPGWTKPYIAADIVVRAPHLEMHVHEARSQLVDLVAETVRIEAPVHPERVLRTIREAWDVGQAGSRIRAAFSDAVSTLVRRSTIEQDGQGFLWLTSGSYDTVRVPVDEYGKRKLDEVCWEERCWAVVGVVTDAVEITREDLRVSVSRLFGWARVGPDISAALDEVIEELEADGQLVHTGGLIRVPVS